MVINDVFGVFCVPYGRADFYRRKCEQSLLPSIGRPAFSAGHAFGKIFCKNF